MPKQQVGRPDAGNRQGKAEQVYDILRAQIFDRQLVAGARLNIDKVARDLGVSATPVREAINRMVTDRLVTYEPYAGYTLAPADDREGLAKLRKARQLIEIYCAKVGAKSASSDLIREMTKCNEDMVAAVSDYGYSSFKSFEKRDNDFHDLVVLGANNPYLVDAYRPIGTRIRMLRLYYVGGPIDMRAVIDEHWHILKAYKKRDAQAAGLAMAKHLGAAGKRLDAMVEQFADTAKVTALRQLNRKTAPGRRRS